MIRKTKGPLDRIELLVNESPEDEEFFFGLFDDILNRTAEQHGMTREELDVLLEEENEGEA